MDSSGKTKTIVIMMVIFSSLLILLISGSFILYFHRQSADEKEVVKTGVVSLNYSSPENSLTLLNVTPVSIDIGKSSREEGSYFDFSVSSNFDSNTNIKYQIALIKDDSSTIPDSDIMVYLEKQDSGIYAKVSDPKVFTPIEKKSKIGSPAKSMVLDTVSLVTGRVDNYRLRIWVKEGAKIQDSNATYSVRVNVYGKVD